MTDRFSDENILAEAAKSSSLPELYQRVRFPDMPSCIAAAQRLGINLPLMKLNRPGAPKVAQPSPKPTGKGK